MTKKSGAMKPSVMLGDILETLQHVNACASHFQEIPNFSKIRNMVVRAGRCTDGDSF